MDKHIKVLYGLLIVGFLSISTQLWFQTQAINELNDNMEGIKELKDNTEAINELKSKVESIRELLFRFS